MASDSPNSVRKVVIHLRATGDAPILKQAKFKVCDTGAEVCPLNCLDSHCDKLYIVVAGFSSRISGTDKFAKVIDFLRRQLHKETLFVYVNSAFSPNPDQLVIDLYDNFGFDGKLMVNYACSMAWG